MLKFMAWERSFEARVLKVREKELKYQKKNYIIEVSVCNIKVSFFAHDFVAKYRPCGTVSGKRFSRKHL